jgi:tripartite-type tricarboxylate transporter receptor subunit TctC
MPDVPTVGEAGAPNFEISTWVGLFAPAATPGPIRMRLQDATTRVLANVEFQHRIRQFGLETDKLVGPEFDEFIRREFRLPVVVQVPPACCVPRTCTDMRICQRSAFQ